MIVGKAVNLAHSLNVPVIGLVENMAYFKCDECGKKHFIFGDPQGEAVSKKYDIPAYRHAADRSVVREPMRCGKVEDYDVEGALDTIVEQVEAAHREEKAE